MQNGLTVNHIQNWPAQVDFGPIRMWDTGTTWKDLEPTATTFNWTPLDNWLAAAAPAHEFLYTFGMVPGWAGGGSSNKNPPSDISTGNAQWKNFVTQLVTRYKGKIAAYELWNEPDNYWAGTPAQLVTMAQDAYTIIKQIDPAALVLSPSPSTANQFGVHFLPAYFAAGGAPYLDVVACHFYQYDNSGNQVRTAAPWVQTSVTQLKALMAQYSLSAKPIWYTEGSWNDSRNFTPPLTDAEKSQWLIDSFSILASNGVARAYWYAYDNPNFGTIFIPGTGLTPLASTWESMTGPKVTQINLYVPPTQVLSPSVPERVIPTTVPAIAASPIVVPASSLGIRVEDWTPERKNHLITVSGTTVKITTKPS